jgi:hypothetical protein
MQRERQMAREQLVRGLFEGRTWDLRGYSGQALALFTNRHLASSYRHKDFIGPAS